MKDTASAEIREREEINTRLAHFWSLPEWTPAMGVLLISGISPVPGCTSIPSTGADLRNPGAAAGQRAFHDALRAWERWTEHWEAQTEYDPETVTPTFLSPFEFLNWCLEEYANEGDIWKPAWLRYWLAYTQMEPDYGVPLPAPSTIVKRAAELETFVSVVQTKLETSESEAVSHKNSTPDDLTSRVIKSIEEGGRLVVKDLVIQALRQVNDPSNPGAVWAHLCTMARTKKHPQLVFVDDGTLKIPYGTGGWKTWKRSALEQFLGRHAAKARSR